MIPEGERIGCRIRGEGCQQGRPSAEVYDSAGKGMAEDGTWNGETVICDTCYTMLGCPSGAALERAEAKRAG